MSIKALFGEKIVIGICELDESNKLIDLLFHYPSALGVIFSISLISFSMHKLLFIICVELMGCQ